MTSPEVAIIGTGLIGTSIAEAAARGGSVVRGFDTDASVLAAAAERSGLVPADSAADAVAGASLIFVCTPVGSIAAAISAALEACDSQAVVTDAGSVKQSILAEVAAIRGGTMPPRFVGGHPMCGSERSGPATASAALLDGATWVLTPTAATDTDAVASVRAWASAAGSRVVEMDAEVHDRGVALVSHLPQLASTALMNLVAREDAASSDVLLLAAGGFRDLTRLAASNPNLWAGIMRANREESGRALDLFIEELTAIRQMLSRGDDGRIEDALERAKRARLSLGTKAKVRAGVALMQIPVPDRPGVFAELTRSLGEVDVNIEDMQIVHSPEGGRGTVHIMVAVEDFATAAAALGAAGFDSTRIA